MPIRFRRSCDLELLTEEFPHVVIDRGDKLVAESGTNVYPGFLDGAVLQPVSVSGTFPGLLSSLTIGGVRMKAKALESRLRRLADKEGYVIRKAAPARLLRASTRSVSLRWQSEGKKPASCGLSFHWRSIAHLDARSHPNSAIAVPHRPAAGPIACRHVHGCWFSVVDRRRTARRYSEKRTRCQPAN
jgi:hypothetical protein